MFCKLQDLPLHFFISLPQHKLDEVEGVPTPQGSKEGVILNTFFLFLLCFHPWLFLMSTIFLGASTPPPSGARPAQQLAFHGPRISSVDFLDDV